MSEELLNCPFCGGKPHLVTRNVEPQGDPWYGRKDETFILCDCGCCLFDGAFHEGFWDAETRAAGAWNRRAASERSAARIAELEEALRDTADTLAMLTYPERIRQSRVQEAWASAVASEAKARAALKKESA